MTKKKILIIDIICLIGLVIVDQISKFIATGALQNKEDIILIKDVLQLRYLENTGAAFSIFNNKLALFYIITPVLCGLIIYIIYKLPVTVLGTKINFILIFILSGAIGNFIDRLIYKYVVDFIYFSLINFPIFNVADIYVTLGIVFLFIFIIFKVDDEKFNQFLKTLVGAKRETKS
ncbi:MAG: signal peptidase II [Lachnospiraceae bacterium]|nr:signal peptidase II [Lachnospiraceae bacterium]